MIEIERKFLVSSSVYKEQAISKYRIVQGFLNRDPDRTVRVRLKNDRGFLTIKGKSSNDGLSRFEWEREISADDAEVLLQICLPGSIDKTRYEVVFLGKTFEVDEFHGENEGLVIAELELEDIDEIFEAPKWLGLEVTGNEKYYNSQLSKLPFTKWEISQ